MVSAGHALRTNRIIPRAPSLRSRLSWLVVAALLPLVLLAAGLSYVGYQAERQRAVARTSDVAHGMALAVERELRAMVASLEALALSPSVATGDLAAFRREANALVGQHFPGAWIILFEPDGQQILNTQRPPGTPLPSRSDMETTRRVLETGRPAISDVYQGGVRPAPVIAVDVPVRDAAGRVTQILSLSPPLSVFAEMLRAQRTPPGWVVLILDRQGVSVARTPNPDRFVGLPASATLRPLLLAEDQGTAETVSLEGTPVLTAWSRPGPSGWSVAIGAPRSEVFASLWRSLAATLALSLLALLGALLLARIVAGRIAGPIGALVAFAADRAGETASASLGLREADAVAAALATAARERRDAEAAHLEGEEHLRALTEALPGLIFATDASGANTYTNAHFQAYTGMAAENLLGDGWLHALHPDDRGRGAEAWARAVRDLAPYEVEYRFRRHDGAHRWHLVRGVPFFGPDGQVRSWFGVCSDIQVLKEIEAALTAGEARLRLALEAGGMGAFDADPVAGEVTLDAEAHALLGLPPPAEGVETDAAPVGLRTLWRLVHPSDRRDLRAAVAEALRPGGDNVLSGEFRAARAEGWRWLVLRGRVERNRAARLHGVLADATARREAEERQTLVAREVDHRAKNVLAVVLSLVRLTRGEDQAAYVKAVEGRVAALTRTHSLLAQDRWAGADLRTLVSEELAPFAPSADGATGEADEGRVEILGPPVAVGAGAAQPLAMALHELVTNAAKYGALSRPMGQVRVSWRLLPGDNGPLRLRWVESGGPPVAGPPARCGFGSQVIGATVSDQLAGTLTRSWERDGLVCEMEIPRDRLNRDGRTGSRLRPGASAPARDARLSLAGLRVLVAEDEAILGLGLGITLSELGCEVIGPAATLEEARRFAAAATPPDAAVLDVDLGGEAAFPAADALAARGVPIVFATGSDAMLQMLAPEERDRRAWAGAPVLRKPYARDDLAVVLRAVVGLRPAAAAAAGDARPVS